MKNKLYFLKCCECNKDIVIYSDSPNKGFTCNNCTPKNCAARNGIDEAFETDLYDEYPRVILNFIKWIKEKNK